jgi:hypothetical protein
MNHPVNFTEADRRRIGNISLFPVRDPSRGRQKPRFGPDDGLAANGRFRTCPVQVIQNGKAPTESLNFPGLPTAGYSKAFVWLRDGIQTLLTIPFRRSGRVAQGK